MELHILTAAVAAILVPTTTANTKYLTNTMRQLSFVKRAATATKVCTMQQHYLSLHFFQHGQK